MRFERQQDIERENKAMRAIANRYDWQYKKLGPHDVDFYIQDIGYSRSLRGNAHIRLLPFTLSRT